MRISPASYWTILAVCAWQSLFSQAFQVHHLLSAGRPTRTLLAAGRTENTKDDGSKVLSEVRRAFALASLLAPLVGGPVMATAATAASDTEEAIPVFKTSSGLKYIELEPGTGPTPKYGQLVSIAYSAYIKLPASKDNPSPKPELFETQTAYLLKHGNARTIAGLDEGLHTMKVGGKRRLLIPPKLGYVQTGLGPIPEYPWDRSKLNRLLGQMITLSGGTIIFEVQLLSAMDDEADQGYYQDDSLTPEEFETLRTNMQRKMKLKGGQLEV